MPPLGPIARRDLDARLRELGFTGPFPGGDHEDMRRGATKIPVPNPHRGDIGPRLLARVPRDAGIGRAESVVDLPRRHLFIRHGLERRDGILQLADVKTRRPHSVALPDAIVAALGEHRERQRLERLVAGDGWEEHGLVFCTRRGRPLLERNVVRTFKAWLARAGLPAEIRLYDLRHSCATLLLAQGVPLRLIMELLGHADIRTTANVYAHVLPALAQETAAAMDAILRPPAQLREVPPEAAGGSM